MTKKEEKTIMSIRNVNISDKKKINLLCAKRDENQGQIINGLLKLYEQLFGKIE